MNNFNNQMQQPQGYGYGMYPNQPGTQYGQFPTAKMTQPLTPEQIRELRSTGSGFSLKVDPIEILRSHCTHKDNGNIALIKNPDGSSTCSVCGETFNLVDKDIEDVKAVVNAVIDILQSVKTYYLDIPENYVKDYFNMIPYLEKLPKFFEVALHNFTKYESGAFLNQNNNMFGFQMLNALTSPGYGQMGGGMMGGQPQMGMAPAYQPQQYAQPQMGMAPAPGMNPFGSVQPMNTGYAPQPQAQPVQNQQPVQQEQQQQNNNNGGQQPQAVSTKTFNV